MQFKVRERQFSAPFYFECKHFHGNQYLCNLLCIRTTIKLQIHEAENLFTCTVTGLLLCTSCIKDEAPNAEADILSCILPAEMLTGTDIDYNRPYDKSLNAYPIYIEVNNGTDLTRLAPTFELTEGASIEPASGSTQNFTNPVRYTVTSEDKNWHRTYAINIHYPETKSIPTVFNFET